MMIQRVIEIEGSVSSFFVDVEVTRLLSGRVVVQMDGLDVTDTLPPITLGYLEQEMEEAENEDSYINMKLSALCD